MSVRSFSEAFRRKSAVLLVAVANFGAIVWQPAEAAAQGFFEQLLGGSQRASVSHAPPPQPLAYATPFDLAPRAPTEQLAPGAAFCVRLCDGRFFPIPHLNAATPIQQCNALCPASRTKIFSGSAIANAVARDGSRYAALENAFVYRKRLVPACTCNGKDSFGLARVDIGKDSTLQHSDIVVADNGRKALTNSGSTRGDIRTAKSRSQALH